MAKKFGFFDSVENNGAPDRVYSSVDFNEYFKGFMGYYYGGNQNNPQYGCGRFANVGQQLKVTPLSGLTVTIGSGKALVDYHWYEQDAAETITFEPNNNASLSRRDRLVLRSNSNLVPYNGTPARTVELTIVKGTPGNPPQLPALNIHESTSQDGVYELLLANVTIRPGASNITASDIDQSTSPWIRGMLDQGKSLDILIAEYQAKLDALSASMDRWLAEKMVAWETWFYDITDNLTVGGYIRSYHKRVANMTSSIVLLDMTGYEFETDDVFLVTYNGLMLTRGTHYNVTRSGDQAQLQLVASMVGLQEASDMDITVLKTNLAQRKDGSLTSITGSRYLYTNNVAYGSSAYGFKIYNLGSDANPVMEYSNRNLAKLDGISEQTSNGVTITPLTGGNAGKFLLEGSNTSGLPVEFTCSVSTKAFAYNGEYTISLDGVGDNLADGVHFTISKSVEGVITDVATADVGEPETFITNDTEDKTFYDDIVVFKITIDADATEEFNYTISPMVEYGGVVHDFAQHQGGTFVYDEDMPSFTDHITYIWAQTDDEANKFQMIYYLVVEDTSADNISY